MRKRIRLAYACPCSGDNAAGRPGVASGGTRQIREVVQEWTGVAQGGCPWFAFSDPFVRRVLDAYPWFENGQLHVHAPHASHRLVQGVGYYHQKVGLCQGKQMELDREEAKKR